MKYTFTFNILIKPKDKKTLLQIEDDILKSLQASDDISELLMDESLINTL